MLTLPTKDKRVIEKAEEVDNSTVYDTPVGEPMTDEQRMNFHQYIKKELGSPEDGGVRNTYILPSGKYVLKVASQSDTRQNKQAYRVWNRFKQEQVGNHLAPVRMRGPGFKYIVQRRARRIGSLKEEEVEIYREMLEESGIITMRGTEEFGRMGNGRVVLVDLGEVSMK